MIASPQSFIIRGECEKAAGEHGYRRVLGEKDGWAAFGSTTAHPEDGTGRIVQWSGPDSGRGRCPGPILG